MLHRAALVLVLVTAAACGSKSTAPKPRDVEGACKVDPDAKASRRASPGDAIACDPDASAGYKEACMGNDVDGCYHLGLCMENEWSAHEGGDQEKVLIEDVLFAAYDAACEGKIVEGCVRLGGVAEQIIRDTPDREASLQERRCQAFLTACQLGDDTDGCPRCIASGCTGS